MSNPVFQLLEQRNSCRAFLPDAVPLADLRDIMAAARRAPSGANLQPGGFHVLTGAPLDRLRAALSAVAQSPPEPSEYSYFPNPMPPHLRARQRRAGYALYHALGIERRDIAGRQAQFAKNYRFFEAPVGIVVTIDRNMGAGCFMDLGMALMALMLHAHSMGYGTCGIGALANHGRLTHQTLGLAQDDIVVCGIALGQPDTQAPVNAFRTERAPIEDYATFHGFEEDHRDERN